MTNLPYLWFLHSSLILFPREELCAHVCVHTVFWCIVLVWSFSILNFIMCMLFCIYNKGIHGFISLNFCICYLSGAYIPCPASLLQHTLSGCFSIHLKDTQQVDAQHRKDQLSQRNRVEVREKGLITCTGRDITAADRLHIL